MAWKTKLAELFVDITAKLGPLKTGLAKAMAMLKTSLARMSRMARRIAVGIGVGLAAIAFAAVKMAMSVQESENLFEVSMGKAAAATRKWSKELSKSLGLNAFEVRKFVSVFNVMLESMGIAPGVTAEMSKKLVELAYDMASFFNLRPEDAFQKLQAAISGESEPLKRLGILINETTIKQWALNNGMIRGKQQLNEMQKVQARYGLILETTAKAQGDLERTSGSATNMLRRLKANIATLTGEIGMLLLPIVTDMTKKIVEWTEANKALIKIEVKKWIDGTAESAKKAAPYLKFAANHIKAITVALIALAALPVIKAIIAIGTALGAIGSAATIAAGGFLYLGLKTRELIKDVWNLGKATRNLKRLNKQTKEEQIAAYKKEHGAAMQRADDLRAEAKAKEKLATADKKQAAQTPTVQPEKAAKTRDEIIAELKVLEDLYTDAKGFEEKLAEIKKQLRHEEAVDIEKLTDLGLAGVKEIVEAKEAARKAAAEAEKKIEKPAEKAAEAARVGLVGFQQAWGQIATGTKRVEEQQLRTMQDIAATGKRQEEHLEKIAGKSGGYGP